MEIYLEPETHYKESSNTILGSDVLSWWYSFFKSYFLHEIPWKTRYVMSQNELLTPTPSDFDWSLFPTSMFCVLMTKGPKSWRKWRSADHKSFLCNSFSRPIVCKKAAIQWVRIGGCQPPLNVFFPLHSCRIGKLNGRRTFINTIPDFPDFLQQGEVFFLWLATVYFPICDLSFALLHFSVICHLSMVFQSRTEDQRWRLSFRVRIGKILMSSFQRFYGIDSFHETFIDIGSLFSPNLHDGRWIRECWWKEKWLRQMH